MKLIFDSCGVALLGLRLSVSQTSEADNGLGGWLCKADEFPNGLYFEARYCINGRTAQVEKEVLVKLLKRIYEIKPFRKLEFENRYSAATAEEIFELVKTP